MSRKQKLELTWVGKDERPRLEPRILLEDPSLSYHAARRVTADDCFDNVLIHGDNLLALKALEQQYRGKVKCIFIDPPYNTGSAFTHYDDGLEHSLWLSMMRDRLEILRELLRPDGSIWITIDDNEAHYLKILCDEVFGRRNFVTNVVWQKKYTVANDSKWLAESHDHILVFAKDKDIWRPNRMGRTEEMDARYRNPDGHSKGVWKATPIYAKRKPSEQERAFAFTFKNGVVWRPPAGTSPRFPADVLKALDDNDEIWFGTDGSATPSRKTFLADLKIEGKPASTVWLYSEVGHNHEAREESKAVDAEVPFPTPKPERLVARILELGSDQGDLVLDSFAGSGTTGAVAQKMGRRWILVELGDHCHTHIVPRLRKVIDGDDPGGVTVATGWQGGGGFRYFRLAPSLMKQDAFGNLVINPAYNPEMLAQAVCQLMGFRYSPSEQHYWQHGQATERDYIYVTTAALTHAQLRAISEDVGSGRTLLICCKAFDANVDAFPNLTVKKIPQAVLDKCEWGRDDYSLRVAALPQTELADVASAPAFDGHVVEAQPPAPRAARPAARRRPAAAPAPSLFDEPHE